MSAALRDGEIYVYIVRWWQTAGIVKARAVNNLNDAYPHYSCTETWAAYAPVFRPGEAAESLEGAKTMVTKRKNRKAVSLAKQINKLREEVPVVDACGTSKVPK